MAIRLRLGPSVVAALLLMSGAQPARAQLSASLPVETADAAVETPASSAYAWRLATPLLSDVSHFGRSVGRVVSSPVRWEAREWVAVPVVAAALLGLSSADGEARDLMRQVRHRELNGFVETVETLGTVSNFRILAGLWVAGMLFGDERARHVAVEGVASAAIAAGLITPALQYAAGRSRPRKNEGPYAFRAFSRNISFPSGHTTHAFAVASVIATAYDEPWVRGVAYGLAGLVGASRMYHDAHHLSDVTAAALIGTVVGRSVARHGANERALRIQPVVTPGGIGLSAGWRF